MSVVTYNGVTLPYSFCTEFRQTAVRDESDTDRCYTKFDISVQTVFTAAYLKAIAPDVTDPADRNAAEIMRAVRDRLLTHRRTLSVTLNGIELLPPATAGAGTVDAWNGPKPHTCDVVQMNNSTFLVSFRIVAHYWENPDPNDFLRNRHGNNVLYNRWTEEVAIDEIQQSRRTRRGKLKIRSDADQKVIPDDFRGTMACLSIPDGFLRESQSYKQSPDGLSLEYTIVDKEVFKLPPNPADRASGYYTESTGEGSALRYGECEVRLTGANFRNESQLIEMAVAVVATKLAVQGGALVGPKNKQGIVQSASVRVDLYKNEVVAKAHVLFPFSKKRVGGIAFLRNDMAFTPFSDGAGGVGVDNPPPTVFNRGSAGLLLQAAAYFDPDLRQVIGAGDITADNDPNEQQLYGNAKVQLVPGSLPGETGVN